MRNNFDSQAKAVFKLFIQEDIPRLAKAVYRTENPTFAQLNSVANALGNKVRRQNEAAAAAAAKSGSEAMADDGESVESGVQTSIVGILAPESVSSCYGDMHDLARLEEEVAQLRNAVQKVHAMEAEEKRMRKLVKNNKAKHADEEATASAQSDGQKRAGLARFEEQHDAQRPTKQQRKNRRKRASNLKKREAVAAGMHPTEC
jgi:hypothetical protein